ncbi:unnamed protein product [Rotaria sp. Silwood1]|nr:unnamed protein product [Rotaria sp. Silwood1]CAF0935383.1 unnamed protein product [Rotaria sp. Silwood1]
MPKAGASSNAAPSLARTIQAKKRRTKNAGKPRPPRDLLQKKLYEMNTGTNSIALYHSAVDGLIPPMDNTEKNLMTKQQIACSHYPIISSPIQTSYVPQSYPIPSNLFRSSTGSILYRIPNSRTLTTTILQPNNMRWDSPINIDDFETYPFASDKKNFQNSIILSSGKKLLRSESLKISNNSYSLNNDLIRKSKLDAKYFCGLAPIDENKLTIRDIPTFRPHSPIISRPTTTASGTAPSPSAVTPSTPIIQTEHVPIPQSDSSFTIASSGGLSSSAPLPTSALRNNDNLMVDIANMNGPLAAPINVESDNEEEENHDIRGSDDDEQEDPKDYCKGGYHPITIGSIFNQRYHVIRKLGWGHFSTVWLCWDRKSARFVAMKVVKSAKHYTETALDEIKLLTHVRESDPSDPYRLKCVQLLDDFKVAGVNGTHVCMVFEVLGHNLLKLIIRSNYRGIPIPNVKTIIKQVLQGLDYLHRKCQIIHTDIKPENVLMCVDEEHVRALAYQAAEWHKPGIKPVGSAVATAHIVNKPDPKTMSKNKKKKLKKKEKQKQKMLELTQQQIQDAEKQKQNLLSSPNQLNLNKMVLTDQTTQSKPDISENISGEQKMNGHQSPSIEKPENKSDESDEENAINQPGNGHEKEQQINLTNGNNNNTEQELNEQAAMAAAVAISGDSNKQTESNETDVTSRPRPMAERTPNPVFELVLEDILQVKIADLGNACWTYQHFTEDIQTRQYRSLEVILGAGYDTSADIWSVACMAFELVTGDYLFEPHSGEDYSRDEDHIAHIIELLGPIPIEIAHSGRYSREFFNKRGQLRNIKQLKPWDLFHVLTEKYKWPPYEAIEFTHFLEPMLHYDVNLRATAAECLMNPWITGEPLFGNPAEGFMYSDEHFAYGSSSNEHSPSALQAGAIGFDFRTHPADFGNFLSAAVGHPQFMHGAVNFHPDESDDDDDVSEQSDDLDEEEDDEEQSDGDESSCLNFSSNDTQKFSTAPKIFSINTNTKSNINNISVSKQIDHVSQINSDESTTLVSWNLFPRSKPINKQQEKTILNEHNPNLILTKQNLLNQIDQSNSKSDYIDWTNSQYRTSSIETTTINNQLDAINFLQEYLEHGNSDVLIDLLHEIAQEINIEQHNNQNTYSAINNNHLPLTPIFNSNLQLSNNKEKKNKKEKSPEKEKKDSHENKHNQYTSNKTKKNKHKIKQIEETTTTTTTTTDSDNVVDSPALINPTRIDFNNPKSPSYSPVETTGFQSFSIPVPQSVAHLSQVQQQLQTNPQNSFVNKTTHSHNISVQQQLQSLSQMARDGDEILITLSVNALTQKQQTNNNNNNQYYQASIQNNNPYSSSQSYDQMMPPPTGILMPRNLEIVAKGFARVQNEHLQPPPLNLYTQQQQPPMMQSYSQSPYTFVHPPFVPRYPIPCHSSSGPPQMPIGPPIQPMFAPPNMMMSGGFARPLNGTDFTSSMRNNVHAVHNLSHINNSKCDYLCQSSLNQPDFRGRPSPGVIINPYFSNPPPSINFSAKQSSKHKAKHISTKNKSIE